MGSPARTVLITSFALFGAAEASLDHVGTCTLTHVPITVSLPDVPDAVIITGPPTFAGTDTAVVRLQPGVDQFKVWLNEPQCKDNLHVPEEAAYWVFGPKGNFCHAVGTVEVGAEWLTVPFPDLGPLPFIFTKSQSGQKNKGIAAGYATSRLQAMTMDKSEFKIKLQIDEESGWQNVEKETVGYFVVRSSCPAQEDCGCKKDHIPCRTDAGVMSSTLKGQNTGRDFAYEIGLVWTPTGEHKPTSVQFKKGHFLVPPTIMVNMQTFNGPNPANVRMTSVSKDSFEFIIDEDPCLDSERAHLSEWVAYFALADAPASSQRSPAGADPKRSFSLSSSDASMGLAEAATTTTTKALRRLTFV